MLEHTRISFFPLMYHAPNTPFTNTKIIFPVLFLPPVQATVRGWEPWPSILTQNPLTPTLSFTHARSSVGGQCGLVRSRVQQVKARAQTATAQPDAGTSSADNCGRVRPADFKPAVVTLHITACQPNDDESPSPGTQSLNARKHYYNAPCSLVLAYVPLTLKLGLSQFK
jgi:hypothetical protein